MATRKFSEEETNAALLLFNSALAESAADRRTQQAVQTADRAKRDAAARLKSVQADPRATAEDKAAAEVDYRAAVAHWQRLHSGEPGEPGEDTPDADVETVPVIDGDNEAGVGDGAGVADEVSGDNVEDESRGETGDNGDNGAESGEAVTP